MKGIPTHEMVLTTTREGVARLRVGTGPGARTVEGNEAIARNLGDLIAEGRIAWWLVSHEEDT